MDSDGVYKVYLVFQKQWLAHHSEKMGKTLTEPQEYLDWLVKQKICPHGVITTNSLYWLELISYMDGEMGLTLPYEYEKTPNIFFQALSIVRAERAKIREAEERGRQKNSNSNQGNGSTHSPKTT